MPASRFGRIAAGSSGWDAEQHAVGWDHPMTDRDANDQPQPGMDIGRERGYEATEPSEDIKSRYYGSDGSTLDYVYELDGDTLTIWFGGKGSPAYYKGSFSDDGDTLTGAWVTPAVAATPPPRPGRAAPRTSSGSTSTAGSETRVEEQQHAGVPLRRVRAGEVRYEEFLSRQRHDGRPGADLTERSGRSRRCRLRCP